MIELDIALKRMADALNPIRISVETVSIQDASDRILASDVHSNIDLPPFDKSAMDGFAIVAGDTSETCAIIETIRAGDTPSLGLKPGYCSRIMTGAPVPENTGQVIPVEFTRVEHEKMQITRPTGASNICRRGEDILAGDTVARQGDRMDPLNLAVLISCGVESIDVYMRPRVTVFSTGDELVTSMADWGPGKIFDSNGPMLADLFRRNGADVTAQRRLPDNLEETIETLQKAIAESDIIAFSGGVSMGDYDYIPDALTACGMTIHFDRIRVKPGKPMTFATGENTCVFGFPGNPVSSFVMFHLFAVPAMFQLQKRPVQLRTIRLPLAVSWSRKKAERLELIPVRWVTAHKNIAGDHDPLNTAVEPLPYHGSAHLSALQVADGLALIDIGVTAVDAGESVRFWPLTWSAYKAVFE